jgi:hypothetical protein
MSWFDHRHYWRPMTNLNTVIDPVTGKPKMGLLIEDCACGAVRQIEFSAGKAPVVFVTNLAQSRCENPKSVDSKRA